MGLLLLKPAYWLSNGAVAAVTAAAFLSVTLIWSLDTLCLDYLNISSFCFSSPTPTPTPTPIPTPHIRRHLTPPTPPPATWLRFPAEPKYTATLLRRLADNGTLACHGVRTAGIHFSDGRFPTWLPAGAAHRLTFTAVDADGVPRCSGGDYYEADLASAAWRSRIPVGDLGNGTYDLFLQVDPRFAGVAFRLRITLLFGNFHGLHKNPHDLAREEELFSRNLSFSSGAPALPLHSCAADRDFGADADAWAGRWTRGAHNVTCPIGPDGRFRCVDPRQPCRFPWCDGAVGVLESNGWVYSAHCRFRIFDTESAWRCLDGRWLFFWGDSNHVDTLRNLLNFILGRWDVRDVPRRFDGNFNCPNGGRRSLRITNVFNGHWNASSNYQGLHSLQSLGFQKYIRSFFSGDRAPDVVLMNSGLHDAAYYGNTQRFAGDAENAAEFWRGVLADLARRGVRRPEMVYRTTVATAGERRKLWYNLQKMEVYNRIVLEKMRERHAVDKVIDNFDLTYAWHFDTNCSDGVHYGRRPSRSKWYGQIGHQYFVDLMLIHVFLNAICPAQ